MSNKKKICSILDKYDIPYWTEGKNVTDRAINITCPYCSDHSNHMGIFEDTLLFNCWRCGTKGEFYHLLLQFTHITREEYDYLLSQGEIDFKKSTEEQINEILQKKTEPIKQKEIVQIDGLPQYCEKITLGTSTPLFEDFLKRRKITKKDCVQHKCYLGTVGEYSNRMIIPIFFNNKIVSYQGADMTGRAQLKYKTAKGNVNEYLYGYDNIQQRMIITEGVFDKWRTGIDAVATFGTHLTQSQEQLILDKKLNELIFLWDSDAYWKAKTRAEYFCTFISKVKVVKLPDGHDPDSLGYPGINECIDSADWI